jgi:hypothetical protein
MQSAWHSLFQHLRISLSTLNHPCLALQFPSCHKKGLLYKDKTETGNHSKMPVITAKGV